MKKLILYGAVLFASCGDHGDKKASGISLDTAALAKQPVTDSVKEAFDSFNVQMDSIIQVRFSPDSNAITVEGHLTRRGDPVICYLPVKRGEEINCYTYTG